MRREYAIDMETAALADRQWGVVTRAQLRALGLSAGSVDRRVRARRLLPLHRGVYALGHRRLRREAHRLAAVLACGEGAVLSHAAAAAHWGLRPSAATLIDVTVPSGRRLRRPGIRLHRHASLGAREVTRHDGVPITTPARTVLDLAATLPRRAVERALDQAEVIRVFDLHALSAVAAAHAGRPGAPLLAALLREHRIGSTWTRSELEEAFLALCDGASLPRPTVNGRLHGYEADFAWADVIVEVDGFAFHGTRRAFERDRRRDARLAAAGVRTLRFTAEQLERRPEEVLAALRAAQLRSISSTR
jgi:hypothetical protein